MGHRHSLPINADVYNCAEHWSRGSLPGGPQRRRMDGFGLSNWALGWFEVFRVHLAQIYDLTKLTGIPEIDVYCSPEASFDDEGPGCPSSTLDPDTCGLVPR